MKLRRLFLPALLLGLLGLASAAAISGCQTDAKTGVTSIGGLALPTTQQVQSARDQADATLKATTQAVKDVQDQLQTLPANDPVRTTLEKRLKELQDGVAKAQQSLDLLDAATRSIQSGQIDPALGQSAGALFGIYGSLAVGVAGIVWGFVKRGQAGQLASAAAQLVQSIEALGPRTPIEKIVLNQVQDEKTRQLVDKIKATLPAPADPVTSPAAAPPAK